MEKSDLNENKVDHVINYEVCLGIQGSFLFLINDLIFHSPFDAFSIKRSISDSIRDEYYMFEYSSIHNMIYKLNEN